ncbi:MAG: DEAD/DEAH box helicase family protein [Gammaproteobacteria bacterium]
MTIVSDVLPTNDHVRILQVADFRHELAMLRAENARLRRLLSQNKGRELSTGDANLSLEAPDPIISLRVDSENLTAQAKIAIFRRLFKGRADVYPVRWANQAGKSGYAPACGNEWKPGICEKPRIKCTDCPNQLFLPLTDQVIFDHLVGHHTIGIYPLLRDDACHFLAIDLDEAEWRDDARALMQSCQELQIPAALEVSRSGKGAHLWVFFSSAIPARLARQLGSAIISHTCSQLRQLKLSSYDRLFPNQDTLPRGGFGNLIALPLQRIPRDSGFSLFVDGKFLPHSDQWAFLSSLKVMSLEDVGEAIHKATGNGHPLDVAFLTEEEQEKPWTRLADTQSNIRGPLPKRLTMTFADQLYFEKAALPQPLANRLIRLAAFQNPEFYQAQAMRFSVWNKPRIISCAENFPKHIALPRGCLDTVVTLCRGNRITLDIHDERNSGRKITAMFLGTLRKDQETALSAIIKHDTGVLSAPTAFGKTVTAAAIIAKRRVNTLILVHRVELLKQWYERLSTFLKLPEDSIGNMGGGRHKLTGTIDIAVMQSLVRKDKAVSYVNDYGQIIVDECHHLSAFSFESILKHTKARYLLGLTATPYRRDGQHPIIFMQCGPIRHVASRSSNAPTLLEVCPRHITSSIATSENMGIQDIFRQLTENPLRNDKLVQDIISLYEEGRKLIVLTERTRHLEELRTALAVTIGNLFVLHGRLSKKQRTAILEGLEGLPGTAPRVLLATGKLLGEGFDHAPLDTLVLAMPISWKGTLQQYAGRLHRDHASKSDVRIYDYVDDGQLPLERMWVRRQRGYRAMGYIVKDDHKSQIRLESSV